MSGKTTDPGHDDAAFEAALRQALHARPEPRAHADLASRAMSLARARVAPPVTVLARTRRWWVAATILAFAAVILVAAVGLYVPLRNGSFDVFWSNISTYTTSTDANAAITSDETVADGTAANAHKSASSTSYTLDGKLIGGAVLLLAIVAAALQTAVGATREGELGWRPGVKTA